jgi:hypothetical protein
VDEHRRHRPLRIEQSPLERARLWVEILAFLAAGCWALYTFIYQTKIAPSLLPPHEIVSVDVRRVAQLPSAYVERLNVTIHNDGSVDVDTIAFAENVYGVEGAALSNLHEVKSGPVVVYNDVPDESWKVVQSTALLFDGAVSGKRGMHITLRPGDSATLQYVVVVPRTYRVVRVAIQTMFDRYPIAPRIPVQLVREKNAVLLQADFISISYDSYFGV